jgi:hypothetical protein
VPAAVRGSVQNGTIHIADWYRTLAQVRLLLCYQ